jgi:hypothetical protein
VAGKQVRRGEQPVKVSTATPRQTPTDRLIDAKEGHIAALDRERDHLLSMIGQLESERRSLQARLDECRPELSRCRTLLESLTGYSWLASAFVATGGIAVSVAGYFNEPLRRSILIGGVAVAACGLTLQLRIARSS